MHLSVDESLAPPLETTTIRPIIDTKHLTESEFYNNHHKHITNETSDIRSA